MMKRGPYMKDLAEALTIRFSREMTDLIKKAAQDRLMTTAALIRLIIRQWLKRDHAD